jgi:UDP-4-amino-4,6-dideoxy-N-acetyl-beta-L-altrosamine transaminase
MSIPHLPPLPYGRQLISEEDVAAVAEALRADLLTTGPRSAQFERQMAEMTGAKHAIVVCNATAALHLAMRVAGVGPGDRTVTSPNTFTASANCAAFVGAIPDFSDIDPVSYNLDPVTLAAGWKPDTKAVVAVDYAGQPANLPEIARVARAHGAVVIEDACHAVGGAFSHEGREWKIGGHPWADLTTFSFHPVKTMTTGEGGMILTDNDEYAERARILRTHGIVRDARYFTGLGCDENPAFAERGPWYYEMIDLGWNYRITDFQCELGMAQLRHLPRFVARRREIVARYNEAFADVPWLKLPGLQPPARPEMTSWHLYTLQFDFTALGRTRTQVMDVLRTQWGIGTQVLYIPVHLQPWYRHTYGYGPGKCPVAETYYTRALSLPLYPAMTDADVERVVKGVLELS